MRVLVTGASGFVGSALVPALRRSGATVVRATRRPPAREDEVRWDPATGAIADDGPLEAVVHLAGESLAAGRWTARRKRAIERSRTDATLRLCEFLAKRSAPPRVLAAASAVGYYGDAGDRALTEESLRGAGFLAEVAERWERACDPLRHAGARVANLRFGVVLGPGGGVLAPMLLPFRLGLGGPMGGGRQYWSWVSRDDLIAAIERALEDASFAGPVNVVAPEPVRQAEFARVLGRVLNRPAILPAPAFALRLLLGEMADALVLASARALPARLAALGFRWRHADLEGALRAALGAGEVDGAAAHA